MPATARTFRSANEAFKYYIKDYESEDYPLNGASEGIRMGESLASSFTRHLRAARRGPIASSQPRENASSALAVAMPSSGSCLPH